jgi:hypothetical protein
MKRRKPLALEHATTQLGRRPMAFRARQRPRTPAPSEPQPERPASTSERPGQPSPGSKRAILAHVKERAHELAASAPPSEAGVAAAIPVTDERIGVFQPIGLADTKSGRRPVHAKPCPQCGMVLGLMHRRAIDRLVAFVLPVHRWQCEECGWKGLLLDRHEFKVVKRRIGRLIIILLAALLALGVMWYLEYIRYSYHPPVEDMGPGGNP